MSTPSPPLPPTPPPTTAARLGKAFATLLICSFLGGLLFSLGPWVLLFKSKTYSHERDIARDLLHDESWPAMKRRFVYGAATGAALGIVIAYLLATEKPKP